MVAPRKTSIDRSLTDAGDKMGDKDDAIRSCASEMLPLPLKGFTPMKSLPGARDALRGEPCGEMG